MSYNSVLNLKALVGGFYQEKDLVGAFSVIVKTDCETNGSFAALIPLLRFSCYLLFFSILHPPICQDSIHVAQ